MFSIKWESSFSKASGLVKSGNKVVLFEDKEAAEEYMEALKETASRSISFMVVGGVKEYDTV